MTAATLNWACNGTATQPGCGATGTTTTGGGRGADVKHIEATGHSVNVAAGDWVTRKAA